VPQHSAIACWLNEVTDRALPRLPTHPHQLLQLLADNAINTLQPDLSLTTFGPLSASGELAGYSGLVQPLPAFDAWAAAVAPGPAVPAGNLTNAVGQDKAGEARSSQRNAPGALLPPS